MIERLPQFPRGFYAHQARFKAVLAQVAVKQKGIVRVVLDEEDMEWNPAFAWGS
jgi:hypothetical protein